MTAAVTRLHVMKEVRALLPTWVACAGAVCVGAVARDARVTGAAFLAYALGALQLGALSFGHEYTNHTLGILLSQPIDRRRLFLTKVAVLAALLAPLTAFVWLVLLGGPELPRAYLRREGWMLLASVWALFVAPPLTLLCRNPIAGVVFTVSLPMLLAIGGDIAGVLRYGSGGGAAIDTLKLQVLWWGTVCASAAGAAAGWVLFRRLDVIDGHEHHIQIGWPLPAPARSADAGIGHRGRGPIGALFAKELRLQQMTFVIAAMFVLGWASLVLVAHLQERAGSRALVPLSMFYFALLSLFVGTLGSAEERHFGTLDAQLLLPVPVWKQWGVKVVTAWTLACVLGVILPVALWHIDSASDNVAGPLRAWPAMAAVAILITTSGLYVSTLCNTGVKAAVWSLPAVVAALAFVQFAMTLLQPILGVLPHAAPGNGLAMPARTLWTIQLYTLVALGAGLCVLLLRFGFENHRIVARTARQIAGQIAAIAAYLALGALVLSALDQVVFPH
jgi:hypothetical protein